MSQIENGRLFLRIFFWWIKKELIFSQRPLLHVKAPIYLFPWIDVCCTYHVHSIVRHVLISKLHSFHSFVIQNEKFAYEMQFENILLNRDAMDRQHYSSGTGTNTLPYVNLFLKWMYTILCMKKCIEFCRVCVSACVLLLFICSKRAQYKWHYVGSYGHRRFGWFSGPLNKLFVERFATTTN